MQNLFQELVELLSGDDRLVSEGKLMKNKVVGLDSVVKRFSATSLSSGSGRQPRKISGSWRSASQYRASV